MHPSLQDDPKVPEGYRRFLPTRFTTSGQAIDAKGESCIELACPRCHLSLPRDVLELPMAFFFNSGVTELRQVVFSVCFFVATSDPVGTEIRDQLRRR